MNNKKNNESKSSFLTIPLLKDITIIAFIVIISWKLLNSNISINIEKFGFSELISLILAFFAISLSIAFYFKANDTSNLFYDNVYKFTKDTSEILGRIEAGFGEKLRHIDEGYSGLRDKIDQMPFDITETKSEIKKEEEELHKQEEDRLGIIEDLMTKAKIKDNERDELLSKMKEQDEHLAKSRRDLFRLKRQLDEVELDNVSIPRDLEEHIVRHSLDLFGSKCTKCDIQKKFYKLKNELNTHAIKDMKNFGLIDEEDELTRKGVIFINEAIRKHRRRRANI